MNQKYSQQMTTTVMTINSVTFTNFPAFIENGEITGYPLMSATVADQFAEQFPLEDRAAITVDFERINLEKWIHDVKSQLGVKSTMTEEQLAEAEEELINHFVQLGLFN